jgi:hypothetical protein
MSDTRTSKPLRWEQTVTDPFLPPCQHTAKTKARPEHPDAEPGRLLDEFLARMSALGATREEGLAVAQGWYDLDDDWTEDRRREVVGWTDEQIRADFMRSRDETDGLRRRPTRNEPPAADEPVDDADATEDDDMPDTFEGMAAQWIEEGGTIKEITGWVGDHPGKAQAVLDAEEARGEDARDGLIKAMRKLIPEPVEPVEDDPDDDA